MKNLIRLFEEVLKEGEYQKWQDEHIDFQAYLTIKKIEIKNSWDRCFEIVVGWDDGDNQEQKDRWSYTLDESGLDCAVDQIEEFFDKFCLDCTPGGADDDGVYHYGNFSNQDQKQNLQLSNEEPYFKIVLTVKDATNYDEENDEYLTKLFVEWNSKISRGKKEVDDIQSAKWFIKSCFRILSTKLGLHLEDMWGERQHLHLFNQQ